MSLTTRTNKGAPLTIQEVDTNFTYLEGLSNSIEDMLEVTDFVTPTLNSNFTNIDVEYRKYLGFLQITGSFQKISGTQGVAETLFTLPVGFRPSIDSIAFLGQDSNPGSLSRILVQTDGDVIGFQFFTSSNNYHISSLIILPS